MGGFHVARFRSKTLDLDHELRGGLAQNPQRPEPQFWERHEAKRSESEERRSLSSMVPLFFFGGGLELHAPKMGPNVFNIKETSAKESQSKNFGSTHPCGLAVKKQPVFVWPHNKGPKSKQVRGTIFPKHRLESKLSICRLCFPC